MKLSPLTVSKMTLLLFVFSVVFSCSKDTDLLLDSVITETEVSVETRNYTELPAEEAGFVLRTYTFSPTYDAYLQGEEGHNQDIIRLQEDVRTSFLMFDLSQVDGPITDAVLQFHVDSDEGDGDIRIHQGSKTDWTEYNLTLSNAPTIAQEIGSMNKEYLVGDAEKVALKAENLASEETTLILSHQKGNDLAFASKEHPRNIGPKLIITYKTEEGAPAIEQEEVYQEEEVQPEEVVDSTQPKTEIPQPDYFVTVNGKSSNDGKTEATAWNIDHAFESALAGDVVYIKAGNYGSKELIADNSGTQNQPILFIGYKTTPGDISSNEGSTFNYGDNLDPNDMPYIKGNITSSKTGVTIEENYVTLENFQISNYLRGVLTTGTHVKLKNVIGVDFGNQNDPNGYDGFGFEVRGNNTTIENCFVLNSTAESIKLFDSDYSLIQYTSVYADNGTNPTDYYFLITGGTNNTLVENCYAEREKSLSHGGHGFDMKDLAENNTFKNCTVKNTSIELNFSGVRYNTITDCSIYGEDTSSSNWQAVLTVFNGANNNTISNVYIQDTWRAINWGDYDDGYVGPGGDRDLESMGWDNVFQNIVVKNTNRILNVGGGTFYNSKASRNSFIDCDFSDFNSVAVTYYPTEDILFKNCKFNNGSNLVYESKGAHAAYSSFDAKYENCSWTNVDFTPPN